MFKQNDMYHFLSSNLTKVNLENWSDFYLDPNIKEKNDYILVSAKVWEKIKRTYGGGPEIQLFLSNSGTTDKNLIYTQPYMYGSPDKNPHKIKFDFAFGDESSDKFWIPITLLLSVSMTVKQILYHWAWKLKVNPAKLRFVVVCVGDEDITLGHTDESMTLEEITTMFSWSLQIAYEGSIEYPENYKNEDPYDYFGLARPETNDGGGNNSSTEAVGDLDDDRDQYVEIPTENNQIFDREVNTIFQEDANMVDDEIPPEYRDDPDLWRVIQESMKVSSNNTDYFRIILLSKITIKSISILMNRKLV